MKSKTLLATLLVATSLFVGCGNKTTEEPKPDAVGTASLPGNLTAFENGIAEDGTWIITPVCDITSKEDLVVEGTFHKKNDAAQDIYRKIGLYAQETDADGKKVVTDQYTLEVPNFIIKSENTSIQNGVIKGDVIVEANGVQLSGVKVEGNVYFANEEVKSTFTMVKDATVSGVQEIKK